MRLHYRGPDGEPASDFPPLFDFPGDYVLVAGGRAAMPSCVTVTRPAVADRPEVEMVVVVHEGRPGCACVSVQADGPNQQPLSVAQLRHLELAEMLDQAVRDLLVPAMTDDAGGWLLVSGSGEPPAPPALAEEVSRLVWRRRNDVDGSLLAAVARAWSKGGVDEVQRTVGRSRSQAYRLVARARDAGLV